MSAPAGNAIARLRAEALQPFVSPADTVLDYGAPDDLNLANLAAARKLSMPVNGDLASLQNIDVIVCRQVLEYQEDPIEIVRALKQVLKPGGTLLVCAIYDKGFRHPRLTHTGNHLYSWNVQTLGNLLIDCGYEFLSGEVTRYPNEKTFARWTEKFGYPLAKLACHFLSPEFEVRVAAKRP